MRNAAIPLMFQDSRVPPGMPRFLRRGAMRYMRTLEKRNFPRAQPFSGFGMLGQTGQRLIPNPSQIQSSPGPGAWYQLKKGDTYWGISRDAYGRANVRKGLMLMNNATWNNHIDKKNKGWEAYKVPGLQATPDYSLANPRGPKGSGSDYPVVWIPTADGMEPEEVYGVSCLLYTSPSPRD